MIYEYIFLLIFKSTNKDWFQSKYDYIYERDIPQLRKMNVTVVRMWEWFYSNDHTKFLNQLHFFNFPPFYFCIFY